MKNLLTLLLMVISVGAYGQTRYNMQQLKRESLNRGVVAIKDNNKVIISWRTLSSDKIGEEFNVYRNGTKINKKALSKGGTFFIDESPLSTDAVYEVNGGGKDGSFKLNANAPDGYIPIKIEKPEDANVHYSNELLNIINLMLEEDKDKRQTSKYFLEMIKKEFSKKYANNTSIDAIVTSNIFCLIILIPLPLLLDSSI